MRQDPRWEVEHARLSNGRPRRTTKLSGRGAVTTSSRGQPLCPPVRLYVAFVLSIWAAIAWCWGSCEEAFRSAEARPLPADWPLRGGPQSLLHLEAPTSHHKLPRRPLRPKDPRGCGPSSFHPSPRSPPCYHPQPLPRNRRDASASASTPPAMATTPSSCATTSSRPMPNWP